MGFNHEADFEDAQCKIVPKFSAVRQSATELLIDKMNSIS